MTSALVLNFLTILFGLSGIALAPLEGNSLTDFTTEGSLNNATLGVLESRL